ncbi:MAG: LamG-like jellyroll fold domain-containing protein [Ignisphaera sp.]
MNKKTLHAILILPLITTILVTIDADTQQTPIILRYIGDVRGGEVFAPHLYDLHFNGVNQYVVIQHSDSLYLSGYFTVMFWASLETPYNAWAGIVDKGRNPISDFWFLTTMDHYRVSFGIGFTDGTFLERNFPLVNLREWHLYCGGVEGSNMFMSIDGRSKVYYPFTKERRIGTQPIAIGSRSVASAFSAVRIAQLLIYRRALSNEEISNAMRGVVSASGLRLFIDPTFFDGVKYIDLSGNGNHAYPYNNPSRVPTENPFLWVIRGLYNDNLVRFRFIPEGWHIVVRLLSGEEIIHIDTSYIDAPRVYGFVDNITINIFTPGRYEIIVSSVYPPVEGEMISMVGFGESLAMFILSAVCLATAGIVAGLRKPELLILVSSLYTCVVLIYVFNPCGGLWAISVSIASLSIPIALLITATGNINQNTSIAASIILSLAIYLPSLGLATSSGAIHGSISSIYTGISIGATIIIMSRIFIKSIPRKTIVI